MLDRVNDNLMVDPQVSISVNGVEDTSLTVSLNTDVKEATALFPSSVSPVLKSEITIYLGSTFTDTPTKEMFTVTAISTSDKEYFKNLYVMSVDQASNSLKVKFPGARTGVY